MRFLTGSSLSARGYVHPCADMSAFRAIGPPKRLVRVIGAIGRLDWQKGFDTLMAAFRKSAEQNMALRILGEGCEEATLRRLAAGDPRIHFMGSAPDPVWAMAEVDAVDGLTDQAALGAQVVPTPSVRSSTHALDQLVAGHLGSVTRREDRDEGTLEASFEKKWQKLLVSLDRERVREFQACGSGQGMSFGAAALGDFPMCAIGCAVKAGF